MATADSDYVEPARSDSVKLAGFDYIRAAYLMLEAADFSRQEGWSKEPELLEALAASYFRRGGCFVLADSILKSVAQRRSQLRSG